MGGGEGGREGEARREHVPLLLHSLDAGLCTVGVSCSYTPPELCEMYPTGIGFLKLYTLGPVISIQPRRVLFPGMGQRSPEVKLSVSKETYYLALTLAQLTCCHATEDGCL